jgi:Fe2+ transport system protein FeoA
VAIKNESDACAELPPLPLPGSGGVPLSALRAGEQGVVATMAGGRGLLCRMTSLGFTPGVEVTVLQNYGRGPLIARVRDARIALGRGEARKIYVHKRSG